MSKIIISLILLFLSTTNALSAQAANLEVDSVQAIANKILDISAAIAEKGKNDETFTKRYGFSSNVEQFSSQALTFNMVTGLVAEEDNLSKESMKRYRAISESIRSSCDYYLGVLDSYSKEDEMNMYYDLINQYEVEVEKLMNIADKNSKIEFN